MKIDIAQLEFINPILREMAQFIEQQTGLEFTITSMYRIGDTGVHGQLPLRGLDLRCPNSYIGVEIEQIVNSKYQYDPNRPNMKCCIYHDAGSGFHIHLQVHPNTRNSWS